MCRHTANSQPLDQSTERSLQIVVSRPSLSFLRNQRFIQASPDSLSVTIKAMMDIKADMPKSMQHFNTK